ncbi:MAG: BlaI/MecI/CopY family transcriptional regulator [Ruminococcaceae bacterium]|nr:BlaI/MecI/CopY family transcriptional regulator [Oscillospiraceae bacterium]
MKNWERLPEAELDVMLTLWHAEEALTVGEIVRRLSGIRTWKSATVHVLLERLEKKNFVQVDKSGYAHLYAPAVTEEEYRSGEQHSFLHRFFGGSAKKMIVSMLDADGLSEDDIEELTALLRDKKSGGK